MIEYLVDKSCAGSAMGPMWYFGPEALIGSSAVSFPAYVGIGHGTPGSLPNLDLAPVKGGGGECVP